MMGGLGANKGIKTETDTATSEWPDPGNISPTLLDGHDYFYMKSPSALPRRLSLGVPLQQ